MKVAAGEALQRRVALQHLQEVPEEIEGTVGAGRHASASAHVQSLKVRHGEVQACAVQQLDAVFGHRQVLDVRHDAQQLDEFAVGN